MTDKLNIALVIGYPTTYDPTTCYVVDNNGELDIVFTDVAGGPGGALSLETLINNRIATAILGVGGSSFIDGGGADAIYTSGANVIDGGGA